MRKLWLPFCRTPKTVGTTRSGGQSVSSAPEHFRKTKSIRECRGETQSIHQILIFPSQSELSSMEMSSFAVKSLSHGGPRLFLRNFVQVDDFICDPGWHWRSLGY